MIRTEPGEDFAIGILGAGTKGCIKITDGVGGFRGCDLVIEAVIEDLAIKSRAMLGLSLLTPERSG